MLNGKVVWEDEDIGPFEWSESGRVVVDLEKETIVVDGRVTIEIKEGSLCSQTTDVITNAANSKLIHNSGVAGRILKQGGEIIDTESKEWIEKNGKV